MSRRQFIAGNWKMFKTISEAKAFAAELRGLASAVKDCDIAVAPTYPALYPVAQALEGSNIAVAAQEMFFEDSGAFTGCVSGPMLKAAGCRYVLIAHSERRQYFGETDETANKRLRAALRAGLVPVLCVGETLAEREGNRTNEVLATQVKGALQGFTPIELATLVVAYEPVWAIGTGKVATPAQAQEAHAFSRERRVGGRRSHLVRRQRQAGQRQGALEPARHRRRAGWRREPRARVFCRHHRGSSQVSTWCCGGARRSSTGTTTRSPAPR